MQPGQPTARLQREAWPEVADRLAEALGHSG